MSNVVASLKELRDEDERVVSSREHPKTIQQLSDSFKKPEKVTIEAVAIDTSTDSGLVLRCPECFSFCEKLSVIRCKKHGLITGDPRTLKRFLDLRLEIVIDDGTGSMKAILHRQVVEDILELKLSQIAEEWAHNDKFKVTDNVVRSMIEERIIAQPLKLTGHLINKDEGLQLIVTEFELNRPGDW